MKNSKNLLKNIKGFLKFFDLYGQNANLYIEKKPKFYSTCSGFLSLVIIFLIAYTFSGIINSWINKEKMTVITSSISLTITQLLEKNEKFEYEFDYKNYYIYFVIRAILPNGTSLFNEELAKYVTYNYSYFNADQLTYPLNWEYCKTQYYDIFLGLDEETIKNDANQINDKRICLNDTVTMGLFPDISTQTILEPEVHFSVYQCVNSSSNDNDNICAPQEEIDQMIKFMQVQASIPTTLFNFQNVKNPQTNFYDYKNIDLDKLMIKSYKNYLVPTLLYTDHGLVYENYRLEETNFNPDLFYDPNIRDEASDPLFDFSFSVNLKVQTYYQKNQKINEIIGSLGGIINAIFLLGKILCVTYNSLFLKYKIIKSTFLNPNHKETRPEIFPKNGLFSMESSVAFSKLKSEKFSCLKSFFPSKQVRSFYEKGAKRLHEYIDIRKIIKRMQDIDKLKMILLNENQRKLFEYIPKPDILANSNEKMSIDNLVKYRRRTHVREMTPNLSNHLKTLIEDNDPINKRILECLDKKIQNKDEMLMPIGFIFIYYRMMIIFYIF